MSYGRHAIEERLEPALRELLPFVGVLMGTKEGSMTDGFAALGRAKELIDELDAYDNEGDRKAAVSKAWKAVERALLVAHPVIEAAEIAPRCTLKDRPESVFGRCHLRGKWTYDGLGTAGCKPHVEKRRDRGLYEIRRAAWDEVDPPVQNEQGRDNRFMEGRPQTLDVVLAVADKLGVREAVDRAIAQ